MKHLFRHWPLAILIVLQLTTIGLHFHRVEHEKRVEVQVENFQKVITLALDQAYALGRSTCKQSGHMY